MPQPKSQRAFRDLIQSGKTSRGRFSTQAFLTCSDDGSMQACGDLATMGDEDDRKWGSLSFGSGKGGMALKERPRYARENEM